MRVPVSDFTFIIRSAGERTLPAASTTLRTLITRAGGDASAQLAVLDERPFSKAVRRTFEIGLDARRPWVVGMDADVLLLDDALDRLGALCAAADGAVFSIASLVLCRFFGGFCFSGIHCYPRRHLERAITLLDGERNSLRPESAIARGMEAHGLKPFGPPVPIGVHDHEQWLRHIHVKMRLRARRDLADGGDAAFEESLALVSARATNDPDFVVAAWGLRAGRDDARAGRTVSEYTWDEPCPSFIELMHTHGLQEKPPLLRTDANLAERIMAAHDYAADRRTPAWIRDRLGFAHGSAHALERIGVASLPSSFPARRGLAAA